METAKDVPSVIQREHDALAVETRIGKCPPLVAVNNMEDAARVPSKLRWDHATTVTALAGAKGAAFIVDCPSLNSTALWVGTGNDYYRDDYLAYLNGAYKLSLS